MLRIALVVTPTEFGGAEKVSLTLLRMINRDAFTIIPVVLVRPWEGKNFFLRELEGENYEYVTIPVSLFERSVRKDYFRVMRCFRLLWSIAMRESFDLIHTNGYFADIIGIPMARMRGIPIVSTCHGFIANDVKLGVYNLLDRVALLFANRIIAVSETIKKDLSAIGIRESKIEVIQNSVQTDSNPAILISKRKQIRQRVNLSESDIVIGYVGRLSEEKGIKFLIEAVSLLDQTNLPTKLLLIGDGQQRLELERFVEKKNLTKLVIFAGFQKHIEDWLPALDIFALPSLTEGTPMALLEAMAQGLPVVASSVGGIPSIIRSGHNGILTQPANPREMADAICTLYQNDQLRSSIGSEAKKTIHETFNVTDWVRKIEAVYLKLLDGAMA